LKFTFNKWCEGYSDINLKSTAIDYFHMFVIEQPKVAHGSVKYNFSRKSNFI